MFSVSKPFNSRSFKRQLMTNGNSVQMEQASFPSTLKSLWSNVLESIVNQTLDHLESHPNLYSITDLNTLHALSNQINVRVQAIQRNVSHLASESNKCSSTSYTAIEEDKSNREITSLDGDHIDDAIHEKEKQSEEKNAQHELNFPNEVNISMVFF